MRMFSWTNIRLELWLELTLYDNLLKARMHTPNKKKSYNVICEHYLRQQALNNVK